MDAEKKRLEIEDLKGELERYVDDYNLTFGWLKLQIIGALFGRRIKKVTGLSAREFTQQTGLFWVVPTPQGGVKLWARKTPMPEEMSKL